MLHAPLAAVLALVGPADPVPPPPPPPAVPFADLSRVDYTRAEGPWRAPRHAAALELSGAYAWSAPAEGGYSMSTTSAIATGVVAAGVGGMLAFGSEEDIEQGGDFTSAALPVAAGVTAVVRGDWPGLWMYAKSVAVSTATVHFLKETAQKWRPDSSNAVSFPSGHTQAATTGAAFFDSRYGHDYGIPAYLAAAYTGASRVIAQKHFTDDVIAGASIALLTNFYFVKPLDTDLSVSPMFTEDGYGISLKVSPGPPESVRESLQKPKSSFKPRFYFDFDFGGAWTDTNTVQAPRGQGDVVDFTALGTDANPTTTARTAFSWYVSDPGELTFRLSPFETRETTTLDSSLTFGGESFSAGETVTARYLFHELYVRYRHELFPEKKLDLKLGGGLSLQSTSTDIISSDTGADGYADEYLALPLFSLHVGYHLSDHWHVYAESELQPFGDNTQIDTSIYVRYHFNERWDMGLGYRWFDRDVNNPDYANEFAMHQALQGFGYTI